MSDEPEHIAELMAEAAAVEDPYGRLVWNRLSSAEQASAAADASAFRAAADAQAAELARELTPKEREQLLLIEAIPQMDRTGARILSEIPAKPPVDLLLGRLHADAHTILYGTGGSRKGTVAAGWIGELVELGHRVLIVDYEDHPDEWSGRIRSLHGAAVCDEVVHVAPASVAWKGRRGALWRQADEIRALAVALDITYVVVDSIVVACAGEDPMDPGTPAKYAAGLQQLGRPVLSLAHVTKDGGLAYPFGSVFWHNLARVTWSLELDGAHSVLTSRKANQHERAGRYLIEVTYLDNLPKAVWERSASVVLGERVETLLREQKEGANKRDDKKVGMTAAEIVARLNDEAEDGAQAVKPDTIRALLRRGLQANPKRFTVTGTDKNQTWTVAS